MHACHSIIYATVNPPNDYVNYGPTATQPQPHSTSKVLLRVQLLDCCRHSRVRLTDDSRTFLSVLIFMENKRYQRCEQASERPQIPTSESRIASPAPLPPPSLPRETRRTNRHQPATAQRQRFTYHGSFSLSLAWVRPCPSRAASSGRSCSHAAASFG